MRLRDVCVCVVLLRQTMNILPKLITPQDNRRDVGNGLVTWKSTWVTFEGETPLVILPRVFQLGVSGKSGIHPYRNSEHRNKEQSLMEECKYQALTVDLTHKSS